MNKLSLSLILILNINLRAEKPVLKKNIIKIGVLANQGKERCLREWNPTAEYLTSKIQNYIFKIIPLGFDEVYPFATNEKIDFFIVNPLYYTHLTIFNNAIPLLTMIKKPIKGLELSQFGGVLFSRSNKYDIVTPSDIKNKKILAVNHRAFGGWISILRELKINKIDLFKDAKTIKFVEQYDRVVFGVRDGQADAGMIRTGILEKMANEGKINLKDFRVMHLYKNFSIENFPLLLSTRIYPEWAVLYLKTINNKLANKVQKELLYINRNDNSLKKASIAGWSVPLNYASVIECIKELEYKPISIKQKLPLSLLLKNFFFFYYVRLILGIIFIFLLIIMLSLFIYLTHKLYISKKELKKELRIKKENEKKIKTQNVFLESILEAVANPLYVINTNDYTIQMANSASGLKIFDNDKNYPDKNMITCYKLTHNYDIPCSDKHHICPLGEVKRTKIPIIVEHKHRGEDGKFHNIEIYGFPILDETGQVVQMVEYSFDITERKIREKELLVAKESAEAANKAKSIFLANMSHELRTPLTSILGISGMFIKPESGINDPEIIEGLSIIHKSGKRLLKLITALLELSNIDADKMEITLSQFALNDLIAVIQENVKTQIGDKEISFIINIDKNVSELIISDYKKLLKILNSLIDNAIKFTNKGMIILNIDEKENRLYFEIRDTGIGIKNKDIKYVFEEFKQIDDGISRSYGGIGMGLNLSKKLVELLEGEIKIESEFRLGTIVRFYIPKKNI